MIFFCSGSVCSVGSVLCGGNGSPDADSDSHSLCVSCHCHLSLTGQLHETCVLKQRWYAGHATSAMVHVLLLIVTTIYIVGHCVVGHLV